MHFPIGRRVFSGSLQDSLLQPVRLTTDSSTSARVIIAVCTGFHFPVFRAGTYFADFAAPSGNGVRHASPTIDVFWFELDIVLFGPSLSYLFLAFKILFLSGFERFAFVAV
jgi:hypothetical protein